MSDTGLTPNELRRFMESKIDTLYTLRYFDSNTLFFLGQTLAMCRIGEAVNDFDRRLTNLEHRLNTTVQQMSVAVGHARGNHRGGGRGRGSNTNYNNCHINNSNDIILI